MLLAQIAYRAKRTNDFNINNLEIGEALIGDFLEIGTTHRKYRTAIETLKKWGFATFNPTNKGTIAKLVDTRVFDINCEPIDKPIDKTKTNKRQTKDKQATTNKNDKNDKNDKNVINIPDWMSSEDWNDFVQHRIDLHKTDKRSPILTETSTKKIINALIKLEQNQSGAAKEAMNTSIMNGWKGVFPPKATKQTKTSGIDELLNNFINEK